MRPDTCGIGTFERPPHVDAGRIGLFFELPGTDDLRKSVQIRIARLELEARIIAALRAMFAILCALGMFVADRLKSRERLEADKK